MFSGFIGGLVAKNVKKASPTKGTKVKNISNLVTEWPFHYFTSEWPLKRSFSSYKTKKALSGVLRSMVME